ncbi:MAG: hypothetical protein U9Q98_09970, partial [Bacteroidota bacterium]|nr:hypothetical protein [Bacteroidota bacterium]
KCLKGSTSSRLITLATLFHKFREAGLTISNEYRRPEVEAVKYDIHLSNDDPNLIEKIEDNVKNHAITLIQAPTGAGKTYKFVKQIRNLGKVVIAEPLTVTVKQIGETYNIAALTGESGEDEFIDAVESEKAATTFEQLKHVWQHFDTIVIDEVHHLFTDYGYKGEVLNELQTIISEAIRAGKHIVLLTATPHNLLKNFNTFFIRINDRQHVPETVYAKRINKTPLNTAIQHLKQSRAKRTVMQINSIDTLKEITDYATSNLNYKRDEIALFYSNEKIKQGNDYSFLVENSKFRQDVRLVLTTAILSDGINIKDNIDEVVYIDNQFYSNPDNFRQFIGRFRDWQEHNTKFTIYRHYPKKQKRLKYVNTQNEFDNLDTYFNSIVKALRKKPVTADSIDIHLRNNSLSIDDYLLEKDGQLYSNWFAFIYHVRKEQYNNFDNELYFKELEENYNLKIEVQDQDTENTTLSETEIANIKITKQAAKLKRLKAENELYEHLQSDDRAFFEELFFNVDDKNLKKQIKQRYGTDNCSRNARTANVNLIILFENNYKEYMKIAKRYLYLTGRGLTKEEAINHTFTVSKEYGLTTMITGKSYNAFVSHLEDHILKEAGKRNRLPKRLQFSYKKMMKINEKLLTVNRLTGGQIHSLIIQLFSL